MTSFIDFVLKSGSPKMTCAKRIKNQSEEDYNVAGDYYKRFREAVQEIHQTGVSKNDLLKTIGSLPDNKIENYNKMVEGYKKFIGKKVCNWFKPPRKSWNIGNIIVPVNPELGLEWNNQKYIIKMYLKSEKPSKDRLASILALMKNTISENDYMYSVLDVRNSKLYIYEKEMDLLIPLVEAEAKALESILSNI